MKTYSFPMCKILKALSRISYLLGVALLIASLGLNLIPGGWQAAQAASVTPVLVAGNPTCESLGYEHRLSTGGAPPDGTSNWNDGKLFVTIISDGTYFDWTSNIGVDAVIAKGGRDGANLYIYDPPAESLGDTDLHAPENPSGGPAGLSHVAFCYDDAIPTNTPTHTPTNTPTNTPTDTPTNTPTDTPTVTPTNTLIVFTDVPTDTPTNTPTDPPTYTPTNTPTELSTATPTNTPTDTPTVTPTNTLIVFTDVPTDTPTSTPINPPTATPTNTPEIPTNTPETPQDTPTNTPETPQDTPTTPPTLPPPNPTDPPQVLIPVTGADLSVPAPFGNLQSVFGNLGLALLGFGMVLQGIARKVSR